MQIQFTSDRGIAAGRLAGRLDVSSYKDLDLALTSRIEGGGVRIALDLAAIDFISSAGLRVILGAAKRCDAAGGELRLAAASSLIKEVLDISGLSQVVAVDDTLDAACQHLIGAAGGR